MKREDLGGGLEGAAPASHTENHDVSTGDSGKRERWEGLAVDEEERSSQVREIAPKVRAKRARAADRLVDGRYKLVRHIASGGMGSVWEALDTRRDVRVALKVVSAGVDATDESKERFRREVALASGLVGRHFPRVFGYGVEKSGTPYLALEYLSGETLSTRLFRKGRLAIAECQWLARELCAALGEAHDFGIIHRDITPKNLMIVDGPAGDELKVLDLGIARHALFDRKLTAPGMLIGSPRYMSPEQVANQTLDGRSDLWSAAVVLYRALVGADPFPGNDEMQALEWAMSKPAVPPSSVRPELGRSVDVFFEAALSRNPAGRFRSAETFGVAFQAAIAGVVERGSARPPSPATAAAAAERDDVSVEELSLEDVEIEAPPSVSPRASRPSDLTGIKTRQYMRRDSFASLPSIAAAGPLTAPVAKVAEPALQRRSVGPLLATLGVLVLMAGLIMLALWLRG